MKILKLNARVDRLERELAKQQRVENALRQNLRVLDTLLTTIGHPVFYQDNEGILQGCNPAFANTLFGISADALIGQPLTALFAQLPGFHPATLFVEPEKNVREIHPVQIEGRVHCADNQKRDFIVNRSYIMTPEGQCLGSVSVMTDISRRKQNEKEKERLIGELKEALRDVKTLSGMLPICSSCKKIRDDKGYWNQIESFIKDHSDADFSHGICPDCAKKLYPDFDIYGD